MSHCIVWSSYAQNPFLILICSEGMVPSLLEIRKRFLGNRKFSRSMVEIQNGCNRIRAWNTRDNANYFRKWVHYILYIFFNYHPNFQDESQGLKIISVDNKVYLNSTYSNHIYEHARWVWIGDKSHPYVNPDFKIRRLFYGTRTEAKRWGLIWNKNSDISTSAWLKTKNQHF